MTEIDLPSKANLLDLSIPDNAWILAYERETKFLCWLAGQCWGNMVELGCNYGLTSRQLCLHNPRMDLFGVDYTAEPLEGPQAHEQPKGKDQIGKHALNLRNFHVVHCKSAEVDYASLPRIRKVFVDANHSYDSVKADSESALAFLNCHATRERCFIAWHDYFDHTNNDHWSGVRKYLHDEVAVRHPLMRLGNTSLAFALLGPWKDFKL